MIKKTAPILFRILKNKIKLQKSTILIIIEIIQRSIVNKYLKNNLIKNTMFSCFKIIQINKKRMMIIIEIIKITII